MNIYNFGFTILIFLFEEINMYPLVPKQGVYFLFVCTQITVIKIIMIYQVSVNELCMRNIIQHIII